MSSSSAAESPWPQSLLPLKEVDNLLRCGICFDYFNIAMFIPQCSHSYCSLCIRKSLSYKAQCPLCSVAATGSDLKNIRILDELVQAFGSARKRLFQTALDSPSVSHPAQFIKKSSVQSHVMSSSVDFALKEEQPFTDKTTNQEAENRRLKGGIRNFAMPSTSGTNVVQKVECPVCGVIVQEMHINNHLDSCLTRDEKKDSLRSSGCRRKFLPKVVYNLLSDRALKKLLKEHGLSTQGTKQQLIKRHQEFVHIYNSQCDSLKPKSVAEIVKEVENIEKTRMELESNTLRRSSMTFTRHQSEKEIDEIHSNYRKKHKAEFQLLIDQMNKRKKHASNWNTKEEQKERETTTEKLLVETGTPFSVDKEKTDWVPTTDHLPKTATLDSGRNKSLDCSSAGGLAPSSFQFSESSNSSSSDILRDLEITGICSDSSNHKSFPDMKTTKQKSRHSRSSPVFSQSRCITFPSSPVRENEETLNKEKKIKKNKRNLFKIKACEEKGKNT